VHHPELSVVVVGYGAPGWLDRCLTSLAGAGRSRRSCEVLLVDNGSPTPLRGALGADLSGVRFVELVHNVGFATACDHAAELARGEVLVFLNPDTEVLPGALDALVDFLAADPRRGLVGGRTLTPEGEPDPRSAWGLPTLWTQLCYATGLSAVFSGSRIFDRESLGWWARDTEREVGVVTGCLLGVRADVFARLGGFDRTYFMYGEDVDLSRRARRAGYRPAVTPAAVVVHAGGASSVTADRLVMVLTGKATLYRRGVPRLRWEVSRALLVAGVALRAAREIATRSPERHHRTALARRAEWLRGWRASDVPPVVERAAA